MENASKIAIVNTLHFCEESNALFFEKIREGESLVSELAIIDELGHL